MLCEDCKRKEASIHFKEIVNGELTELHLCETCAEKKGLTLYGLESPLSLINLLAGLAEVVEGIPFQEETLQKCKTCGITWSEFKKRGRLGCSECYQVFSRQLSQILRKIHGHIQHVGKTPEEIPSGVKRKKKIQDLRMQLEQAVKLEEFEKAAKLRDKIRELEKAEGE
ncbi:MAG: UvrB/UvrC motif-containing protein [bacterium]|nr:UvrB/UvrC motif-containing protein [bacterium]